MSIRETSEECSISPLEIFDTAPTQTAVEQSYDVEFLPTSALRDGGVIEFYVPASSEDYIDLRNSRLYIKAKIVTNSTGEDVDNLANVAPINNLLQSMWSNIELIINEHLVAHSNNVHGYVATISHLLHDSEEYMNSEGRLHLLYKDTAGKLGSTNALEPNTENSIPGYSIQVKDETSAAGTARRVASLVTGARIGNYGLHQRFLATHSSRSFEMLGGLRIDMFEQIRYLPSGIAMKLRLHPQQRAFCLMAPSTSNDYKLQVLQATLIVRKVKVSPGVIVGHDEALQEKPAEYPVVHKECKSFAIASGLLQFKQDNIFLGQLPTRVVLAMVTARAFNGSFEHNPFNFELFGAKLVQVYADGKPVRSRPFQLTDSSYAESYNSLFRGMGRLDGDRGSVIKLEDWSRGYSLFAFNLAPDGNCDDHGSLIQHGNLRVEVQFSEALAQAVQLLVYAEFDSMVKIDRDRQVFVDYV